MNEDREDDWGEPTLDDYSPDDDEFEVDEEWAEIDEISEWEYVDEDWR